MVYEQESSPAKRFVERVGKRNLIIAGVVLLIGVAVALNWIIFANQNAGFKDYDASAGMSSGGAVTTPAANVALKAVCSAREIAATVDCLKDTIKKYMEENQLETLTGNEHKATYKTVTSSRIDTTALKRNVPDIAEKYTKTTETKRFTFV